MFDIVTHMTKNNQLKVITILFYNHNNVYNQMDQMNQILLTEQYQNALKYYFHQNKMPQKNTNDLIVKIDE